MHSPLTICYSETMSLCDSDVLHLSDGEMQV